MIGVIGLGFVGLTTALGFSEKGFSVIGYDTDVDKSQKIKNKEIPFFEPGLKQALSKHINKNFELSSTLKYLVDNSKILIVCVGTPTNEKGECDLNYLYSCLKDICSFHQEDKEQLILIKSTVPPSTCSKDINKFLNQNSKFYNKSLFLGNNPEFLREGFAWEDFINPDRIVVGLENEIFKSLIKSIYEPFSCEIHFVTLNMAEFIKYSSNSLLATLISFSNELSMIADKIGNINIKEVFKILHDDKRWSGHPSNMSKYFFPGSGFGGYCLPKDIQALSTKAKTLSAPHELIESVIKVNEKVKVYSVEKIIKQTNSVKDKIAFLGLSFKPDSDDVRESPSKDIINLLIERGFKNITAYDPIANHNFKVTYPEINIKFSSTMSGCLTKANLIVINTAWSEFSKLKNQKVPIINLRNL